MQTMPNETGICRFVLKCFHARQVNVDAEINHPFYGEYSLNGFPAIRIFKRMYDTDPNTQPLGQMDRWDVEDKTAEQVQVRAKGLGEGGFEITALMPKRLELHVPAWRLQITGNPTPNPSPVPRGSGLSPKPEDDPYPKPTHRL